MRGLMAKPKKSTAGGGEIIENQFFLTLKVFLFLSTLFLLTVRVKVLRIRLENGGCRILTRRLHDVSQDVIVNIEDCGTLRGVEVSALKRMKKC
jgi:DNA-directed RNA polymerase subunit beta'